MKRREFLETSVVAAALVALISCSSRSDMHEAGLVQGTRGSETASTNGGPAESPASGARLMLRNGWQVQTSSGQPEGEAITKAGFATNGWFSTAIPATVCGVLAQAGVYPDPFFGTNFRNWQGRGGREAAGEAQHRAINFLSLGGFGPSSMCPRKWQDRRSLCILKASTIARTFGSMAKGSPIPIRCWEPCVVSPSTSPRPHGRARGTRSHC